MGKPVVAELGEGIDLGGSLCGGVTPNPSRRRPWSWVLCEARSTTAWSSFTPRQAGGVARVAARQAPLPSRAHLAVRLLALRVSSSLQKPLPSSEPVPKALAGSNRLQLDLPHLGPLTGWKAIPTGMGMGVPQVSASFLVYPPIYLPKSLCCLLAGACEISLPWVGNWAPSLGDSWMGAESVARKIPLPQCRGLSPGWGLPEFG